MTTLTSTAKAATATTVKSSALAASGSGTTITTLPPGKGLSVDYSKLSATLNASGSSFQAPFQEAMIASFQQKAPKVTINYGSGGSGKGKTDLRDQVVDFAGTDSLVSSADKAAAKGGDIMYFPTVAGPITVSFNLKNVNSLRLSADTIAKIFQVQIKNWNDAAIAADNPGVSLPSTAISVVHRSDGSGTTNNFSGFLAKAAPDIWKLGRGDTVNWDSSTQAGNGNRGVAQLVQATDGAVGYVDFADAKASGLTFASIKNAAGKYVPASLAGVSEAMDHTTLNSDMTYDPLNATGDGSYPIATPTWMLVYRNQPNKAKGDAIKGYLNYVLTDGQNLAADANYARLPDGFCQNAIAQLTNLNIPSS